MPISFDDLLAKHRHGIVLREDVIDFAYKQRHPRRYRWLNRGPQEIRRFRQLFNPKLDAYPLGEIVKRLPFVVFAVLLLPLLVRHWMRFGQTLTEAFDLKPQNGGRSRT
jgi:hypothetical protein